MREKVLSENELESTFRVNALYLTSTHVLLSLFCTYFRIAYRLHNENGASVLRIYFVFFTCVVTVEFSEENTVKLCFLPQ